MSAIDYQLHGLLSLRIKNASKKDQKALEHQLGVLPSENLPDEQIDITIGYQDHVSGKSALKHLVMGAAAFNDDDFYVTKFSDAKHYAAQIPISHLGQACTIKCQHGIGEIPLLLFVINLRMLEKGYLPVHASAFRHNGIGVMVNGFPKGGKTSILFSFLSQSAQFVSDDWLYIDDNGQIYGLAQPIKLSDWQLERLPEFRQQIKSSKWMSIKGVQWLDQVEQSIPDAVRRDFMPAKAFHRVQRYLNKKQRHIYVSPLKLFDISLAEMQTAFDLLILTMSHDSEEIIVEPLDHDKAIDRLTAALEYEWLEFMDYYVQYTYAFPKKRNSLIDGLSNTLYERLQKMMGERPVYAVYHPHPVDLHVLYSHIEPIISTHRK